MPAVNGRASIQGQGLQVSTPIQVERPYVLDASRLVWRLWTGRLPTGIDRVCLAYVEAFAGQSLAMLQSKQRRVVLSRRDSDALFALLLKGGGKGFRRKLVMLLAHAIPKALLHASDLGGRIYLNVGHTGLNAPGLANWLAEKGLKPVYLIHDLIPVTHPQYCRTGESERHKARMRQALASARGVIVNSAATGEELAKFARSEGLPAPETLVVWLGIEPLAAGQSAQVSERPYFLSIGTIEARKNHMLLLRVWDRLRDELGPQTPDLVVVGQRGWEADDVFAVLDRPSPAFGRVIEHGRSDDSEMAALITNARALLMPSFVEGFGLPVLEAMALGTPVIVSDLPVFREIAQGIPQFVAPGDDEAWLRAIRDHIADGPEREERLKRLNGYSPPDWPSHMARVRDWLGRL